MICIPITARTTNEALKDIKNAKQADIIELRADFIRDISINNLKSIIKKSKKPLIVTVRKRSEGGKFSGSEEKRINLLKKAIELSADFVDIELSSGTKAISQLKKLSKKTKIIVSHHNFKKTPDLNSIYSKIKKTNCDVIKIAAFAQSIDDNIKVFDIIKKANKDKKKIIALCMGVNGELSRILSPALGAFLTFGSLKKGKESAPGQIEAKTLKEIYRVNRLKNPKIYGLVANPVAHSKGFLIHNKSFEKLKLNSIYVNFLVENINSFIKNFKKIVSGLSITIPHKRAVIRSLDKIERTAKNIGAVNTIVVKNGKLIGSNTDMSGAINAIKEKTTIKNKKVLMIGAGGVARAVVFGIKQEQGDLIIVNRTVEKAKKLSKELDCDYGPLSMLKGIDNVDILINCTSIGMHPAVNKTPINKKLLKKIMKKNAVVFDTVYNPLETKLLKDSKSIGCKTIRGVDMFVNQAAAQFNLWTNKKAPLNLMKKIAVENLK
ncbi:shikimate dehydrogenase [Candidatus Woesearchaeota archaeon]|nr:shikimate dehydrogenase [Candidatus Woesearchaeota archaeon]